MFVNIWKKAGVFVVFFLGAWFIARYLFPVALPFFLGALIALAADPAVRLGTEKLSLPRWLSTGVGVLLTLILLVTLAGLLCSLAVKELSRLAGALPDMQATAKESINALKGAATNLAAHTPKGIRPIITNNVQRLFTRDQVVTQRVSEKVLTTAENILSRIPGNALGVGVTLISAFMISHRLPLLRDRCRQLIADHPFLSTLGSAKKVVGHWLIAQLKLSGITFGIITLGLLLLGVHYAPLIALGVALVDALPVLGTGIILLPWGIITMVQGNHLLAFGLLGIYGIAMVTRTILEPRLLGDHLGLDPLLTLVFLYCGFRFWGIAGMLLAPILAAVIKCVLQEVYLQKRQK